MITSTTSTKAAIKTRDASSSQTFPLFRKTRGPPNVAPPNPQACATSVNRKQQWSQKPAQPSDRKMIRPLGKRSSSAIVRSRNQCATPSRQSHGADSRVRKFKSAAPRPATTIDRSVDLTSTAAAVSTTSTSTGNRYHSRMGCVMHCSR